MISVAEMREAEKRAIGAGMTEAELMENAGMGAAVIVDSEIKLEGKAVFVFCGTGNNAGDGLVFAGDALEMGANVTIFFVKGTDELKPLPRMHYERLLGLRENGKPVGFEENVQNPVKADVLVDAMLGTGLRGSADDTYSDNIRLFNSSDGFKVSLDCPSGLDADTGQVMGISVKPDMTVTFHDVKSGMDENNSGRVEVVEIGIPVNKNEH